MSETKNMSVISTGAIASSRKPDGDNPPNTSKTPPKPDKDVKFSLAYSPSIPLDKLPEGCYLVHATNCLGIWGAGVAKELRMLYPGAFEEYKVFCHEVSGEDGKWPGRERCGQCLVCEPEGESRTRVVCLFTSRGFGKGRGNGDGNRNGNGNGRRRSRIRSGRRREGGMGVDARRSANATKNGNGRPGKDPPGVILQQTESALREFRELLERQRIKGREMVIYSPRFNAGLFKVPWESTEARIREVFDGFEASWVVLQAPE